MLWLEAASSARDSTVTDWLTAVGTVGAVGVALFIAIWGDWLKGIFAKPILAVGIRMEPPDCLKIRYVVDQRGVTTFYANSYYCRLAVRNDGRLGARNVEVSLLSLSRRNDDGQFEQDRSFIPLSLVWSNSNPRSTVADRIPPDGLSKHCDFCHVVEDGTANPILNLDTEVTPTELAPGVWPTRKPVGTYQGRLAVTSDNAKPYYRDFTITYTGWKDDEDDMFREGLVIAML